MCFCCLATFYLILYLQHRVYARLYLSLCMFSEAVHWRLVFLLSGIRTGKNILVKDWKHASSTTAVVLSQQIWAGVRVCACVTASTFVPLHASKLEFSKWVEPTFLGSPLSLPQPLTTHEIFNVPHSNLSLSHTYIHRPTHTCRHSVFLSF